MKRTAEIIITVIGILLYGLPLVMSGILLGMKDDPQFQAEIENFMNSPEMETQGEVGAMQMGDMMEMMGSFAQFVLIAAIIAIALGILSIVFLKGNKKPKAAGIILIITAIIMTFATVGVGIFAGVAYLVAGIVALVRKPKQSIEEEGPLNSY